MYPHFIELHLAEDGCAVSLNIDNIVGFRNTDNNGAGYTIKTADDGGWYVKESYEDIKRLISDSGALIAKADPRLEALTISWDTLTTVEMIGEPVYNSNSRRWMLVIDSANDGTWVELINHAGGHEKWGEHELRKYPLYRMRRE